MSTHLSSLELAPQGCWFKSSHSGDDGSSCIEVAHLTRAHVALRDSKQPQGPALLVPSASFAAFVEHVKAERL